MIHLSRRRFGAILTSLTVFSRRARSFTAYTSSQNGNWADASTWGGMGPPVDGDTCTISHTVTVAASTTAAVGNSTPGGDSVVITATTGTLVINGTLTINGDLNHQGTITMGPDSILEFGNAGYEW